MNGHRYGDEIERMRSSKRIALLEVERVVALSLEGLSPQSVLDVGTGSGLFAEAFAAQGLEIAGIDANPAMLAAARRHVSQGDFQQAPAEAIPHPDNSFTLVFLGHVLHEADDPVEALKEARRVAMDRVMVLEWPYQQEQRGPALDHRLKPEQIAALAHKAGFEDIETLSLSHMVLYRLHT